ncbi:DUF4407 domain-containing protein [Gaetbulibacter saemankumensis]|uniref:DUF4407 domain-containing protein n=1 Tax=Gaetbulibacter saemankumensis TaxID=311208 RepID=UPI0004249EEE|nr:DUF4407 domain-containing protein [Gaetbulibacter saemankumensis]
MLKRFFIICSGADTQILNSCASGEQNKYAGIGATVFFTAIMAFIAASYALYTVFDNLFTSIFFGLIWGLLIFNLDRYIVSTIKKSDGFLNELLQAAPRIILAIIIAIVIAKPLELKIFEKEINRVLLEKKNQLTLLNQHQISEQFQPKTDNLKQQISKLKSEITTKEQEVNALYDIYISEAEGTAGTKLLGKGPVYKEKREKHDEALVDLQQLKLTNGTKIESLEKTIAITEASKEKQIANSQPIIDHFDGFLARINALDKLPWLPSFFIFLLFLAIETAPIFTKLLAAKGSYDLKLEDHEAIIKTQILLNKNQREKLLKAEFTLNDHVYKTIVNDEELINDKQAKAKELLQFQADTFLKNQKNIF